MSSNQSLFPWTAAGLAAATLLTTLWFFPDLAAAAGGPTPAETPSCICPEKSQAATEPVPENGQRLVIPGRLDTSDEIAALTNLQFALTEIADGASFVWRRRNGRLSGLVKPLASFKDAKGTVCRHILIVLNTATDTGKIETVACRLPGGGWQLDG